MIGKRKGEITMWQDWINFFFGLWLAASPWLIIGGSNRFEGIVVNCVITGLLIAGLSLWAAYSRETWQDWIVIFLCVWLFVSAGVLSHGVMSNAWNSVITGVIAGILAIVSIKRHHNKMIAGTT
jgi:hypothetical protein